MHNWNIPFYSIYIYIYMVKLNYKSIDYLWIIIEIFYYIIIYCFIKMEKILCDWFFLDSEDWKCLYASHVVHKLRMQFCRELWIAYNGLKREKSGKVSGASMSLSTDSISRIADGGNKQAVFIL